MQVFLPSSVEHLSQKERVALEKILTIVYSLFLLFGVGSMLVGLMLVDYFFVMGGIISFVFGILSYVYNRDVVCAHNNYSHHVSHHHTTHHHFH